MSAPSQFSGRRVLVSGGAGGLGRAIVQRFTDAGATVFALDYNEEALCELKAEFPNVATVLVNLLDWDESKKAVETILPLHHLVNNAAIVTGEELLDTTPEQLDRVFGVNFKAAYNLTQVFAKGIIEHKVEGGTIVNISSILDRMAARFTASYACSKAAMSMLARSSAAELGQYGIRANSVRPTGMNTTLFSEVMKIGPEAEAMTQSIMSRAPIKAELEPKDVAKLVLFLSSTDSSMITGEDVTIDAGTTAA